MKEELLLKKLDNIETELIGLKSIVLSKFKPKGNGIVSFRGLAKTPLGDKALDEAIAEAKKLLHPKGRFGA